MGDARCTACDLIAGRRLVPGGIVWRGGGFALHALDGPSPLPGWLVLTAERHARALYDLDEAATAALGPLCQRVMALQRQLLGAEHAYLFAIGDALHHAHFHLVPRYASTPDRLRGRGAFEARPEDMRPPEELAAAARLVGEAMVG